MPYSDDAEKGVLSCLLQNPEVAIPRSNQEIDEAVFYHPSNRTIYREICNLHGEGAPVDLVSLSHRFLDMGLMDKIGGPSMIAELYSFIPTTAHLPHYLEILKELQIARDGIQLCTDSISQSFEMRHGQASEWSARLVEKSLQLHERTLGKKKNSGRSFHDVLKTVIDRASEGIRKGPSTGFELVDKWTGGVQEGRMTVIAGGTSDGKTAIALQICSGLAIAGMPGTIFSLEMPGEEVVQRIASCEASVRSGVWQGNMMDKGELQKFQGFVERCSNLPIDIFDELEGIDEIAASIRIGKGRRSIKWALIDYAQLANVTKANGESREQEVATISRIAKRLAMSLGVHVFLLSQLNDNGLLRESRAIGQNADNVWMIETTKNENERLLKLVKNRGGPRGKKVLLSFEGEYFQFREKGEFKEK